MTEIDTSREAVEAMAQYYAGWARDIRAQGIHSEDAIYRDKTADTIRALLAENERLRAERDELAKYAREATVALTSLTPGGSEYFGRQIGEMYTADLQACVAAVRDRFERSEKRLRAALATQESQNAS